MSSVSLKGYWCWNPQYGQGCKKSSVVFFWQKAQAAYNKDKILKSFWVNQFSFFFNVPDLSKMKLSLGHIDDAGLETCFAAGVVALWLCSSSKWASKPRARGPGPEAGCWNQSKTGSVLALGSGNISSPSHGNSCPSTGQFLPHESSPILLEMLCAIAVAGQKALILVWLHPGNSPYESRYSPKCIFSAQIRSWGVRQTPCTSKRSLQERQEERR